MPSAQELHTLRRRLPIAPEDFGRKPNPHLRSLNEPCEKAIGGNSICAIGRQLCVRSDRGRGRQGELASLMSG